MIVEATSVSPTKINEVYSGPMTRLLSVALLSFVALSAALAADSNHPTGTRGLLLIDKLGSHIRFFDPVTYTERSYKPHTIPD